MSFADEVEAFRAYERAFPTNAILLIDTYDTIEAAHRITQSFRPGEKIGMEGETPFLIALLRLER